MHDEKIYVSVGGLSFADVIYTGDFYASESQTNEAYQVVFDDSYISPEIMALKYEVEVLTDSIPSTLHDQLIVVRDTKSEANNVEIDDELEATGVSSKIDISRKLMYTTIYRDGSFCDANKKGRLSKIIFYCDQYADQKDKSFKILDSAETDTCEYSFKVSTRFMC